MHTPCTPLTERCPDALRSAFEEQLPFPLLRHGGYWRCAKGSCRGRTNIGACLCLIKMIQTAAQTAGARSTTPRNLCLTKVNQSAVTLAMLVAGVAALAVVLAIGVYAVSTKKTNVTETKPTVTETQTTDRFWHHEPGAAEIIKRFQKAPAAKPRQLIECRAVPNLANDRGNVGIAQ